MYFLQNSKFLFFFVLAGIPQLTPNNVNEVYFPIQQQNLENASPKKTSLEFTENRDEIMKKFQKNFINIYEGKPLETLPSNPLESSYSPTLSPENNKNYYPNYEIEINQTTEQSEKKENVMKYAKPRNAKKEKIKKILSDIEKKKMRRMEIEGPQNPNVVERNCLNSKIIAKNDKVLFF